MVKNEQKRHRCLVVAFAVFSLVFKLELGKAEEKPQEEIRSTLEEVIVTAQKRPENIMDIPAGVSVIDAGTVDRAGATRLTDLSHSVAGVYLDSLNGSSRDTQVSVRGVPGLQEPTGIRSGVGFFVDGVNVFDSSAFNLPLLDVDHIEVLKGPQPAAFGRSALGGAINLVTAAPPKDLSVKGDVDIGNYNLKQTRLSVGGPLVGDILRASLSVALKSHDGYLTNLTVPKQDVTSPDIRSAKLVLFAQPSERFWVQFIQDYIEDTGYYGPLGCFPKAAGCAGDGFNRLVKAADSKYRDSSSKHWSENLQAAYDFAGGYELKSIAGYRYSADHAFFDITSIGTGSDFADSDDRGSTQFSEEVRLVSPDLQGAKFVVGGLYTVEHLNFEVPFVNPIDVPGPNFPQLSGPLNFANLMLRSTNAYSLFASGSYSLNKALSLDGGLRITHETTTAHLSQFVTDNAGLGDEAAAQLYGISLFDLNKSKSWNNPEGQVALSYHVNEDTMVYGRVSRGVKSGGFTQIFIFGDNVLTNPAFGPEKLVSYELGAKAEMLEHHLRLTGALYQNNYTDIQVRYFNPSNFPIRLISNASKAKSYGAEVELSFRPNIYFSMTSGLAVQRSEYLTALPLAGINSGNEFETVPHVIANTALSLNLPIGTALALLADVDAGSRSPSWLDNQNQFQQSANTILNARLGVSKDDGKLVISGWVRNATNRVYATQEFGDPTFTRFALNDPRTFGVEVAFRY